MSGGQRFIELARVFFQVVGLWEFPRYIYRWIFKRRSKLEDEVETLEYRVAEQTDTIKKLRNEQKQLAAELKSARDELPGCHCPH